MMFEHFLHRIFRTFFWTLWSAMEYLALHLSQINLMGLGSLVCGVEGFV